MISLQTILLLSIGITYAVAWDPNCTLCKYYNGIGFIKSDEFCGVYYMCVRYPYNIQRYKWYAMCCPEFMTFDEEHLTCKRNLTCRDPRYKCPDVENSTIADCPNRFNPNDDTKYFVATGEEMMCPYGTVWDQFYCTCVRGPGAYKKPCCKLLHYGFSDTYDSYSCYNFASGIPYGKPALDGDMLCLNGKDQFLSIPYLNNYFAWNPLAKTFTICFWFRPFANLTGGIIATNCDHEGGVLTICLVNGQLQIVLGQFKHILPIWPYYRYWNKICVTFDNGVYKVYFNGYLVKRIPKQNPYPDNSQIATTLGYVKGKGLFYGYFDDFCFYTKVLTPKQIYWCYAYGPSNLGYFKPPPGAGTTTPAPLDEEGATDA